MSFRNHYETLGLRDFQALPSDEDRQNAIEQAMKDAEKEEATKNAMEAAERDAMPDEKIMAIAKAKKRAIDESKAVKKAKAMITKTSFRGSSFESHPDKGGSGERFTETKAAFSVLADPEEKRKYDIGLRINLTCTRLGLAWLANDDLRQMNVYQYERFSDSDLEAVARQAAEERDQRERKRQYYANLAEQSTEQKSRTSSSSSAPTVLLPTYVVIPRASLLSADEKESKARQILLSGEGNRDFFNKLPAGLGPMSDIIKQVTDKESNQSFKVTSSPNPSLASLNAQNSKAYATLHWGLNEHDVLAALVKHQWIHEIFTVRQVHRKGALTQFELKGSEIFVTSDFSGTNNPDELGIGLLSFIRTGLVPRLQEAQTPDPAALAQLQGISIDQQMQNSVAPPNTGSWVSALVQLPDAKLKEKVEAASAKSIKQLQSWVEKNMPGATNTQRLLTLCSAAFIKKFSNEYKSQCRFAFLGNCVRRSDFGKKVFNGQVTIEDINSYATVSTNAAGRAWTRLMK